MADAIYNWFDNRLNISTGGRKLMNKIFPDHWSFLMGEIALYSFVVLLATGIFLSLYFIPSTSQIVYHGTYLPLRGQSVSEAYASTIDLSFAVRAGLLMRQMHHWSANIFLGAIVVHMCRIYFTGGFRRPREMNWIIGVNLLILSIFEGFLGYSLPDDLVSGTGIRIALSILESLPIVGTYLATFLFGGKFPGTALIPRFFIIHVLILPAVLALLIGAHLGLLVRQKHTQFRGGGAAEHNVVGAPIWPGFMAKTQGFFFLVAGVTAIWVRWSRSTRSGCTAPTSLPCQLRRPARLVHGLAGRSAPASCRAGRPPLPGPHDPERLLPGGRAARYHVHLPHRVAAHRGSGSQETVPTTIFSTGRAIVRCAPLSGRLFCLLFRALRRQRHRCPCELPRRIAQHRARRVPRPHIAVPIITYPLVLKICRRFSTLRELSNRNAPISSSARQRAVLRPSRCR